MKKLLYTTYLLFFLNTGITGVNSVPGVPICEGFDGITSNVGFVDFAADEDEINEVCRGIGIGIIGTGSSSDFAYYSRTIESVNNISNFSYQLSLSSLVATLEGQETLTFFEVVKFTRADVPIFKIALQKSDQINFIDSQDIWLLHVTWVNPFTDEEMKTVLVTEPDLATVDITFNYNGNNSADTYVAINGYVVPGANQVSLPLGLMTKMGFVESDATLQSGDSIYFSLPNNSNTSGSLGK